MTRNINVNFQLDLNQLALAVAQEMDAQDVGQYIELDPQAIAEYVSTYEVAREIDITSFDLSYVAEQVADQFDANEIADSIDMRMLASQIDLTTLAQEVNVAASTASEQTEQRLSMLEERVNRLLGVFEDVRFTMSVCDPILPIERHPVL